jgi:hypothetical protein
MLLLINPDQRLARTDAAARKQYTQRAGFGQTTDTAAITDFAKGGLGWCQGLNVNDLLSGQKVDLQSGHCRPMYRLSIARS